MDYLWTPWTYKNLNKLLKRVNGVHGLSMDSMDLYKLEQTFEKGKWSPWILENFHGVHGL